MADQFKATGTKDGFERHGGDLDRAAARYGDPVDGWVDLSTGINPRAYPLPPIPAEAWTRLPQASAEHAAKAAAAEAYGAKSMDLIVCAPGTQILIQALPRVLSVRSVAVVGPTYSEHAAAWRAAGVLTEDAGDLPPPDRSVVVVNPNNPDGRTFTPDQLAQWAAQATQGGHVLIVDEAYADVRPDLSLVPRLPFPNVVILRSFGKFHGLAGLRLGFAVSTPEIAARLADDLGPWAVSGPALEVGARALADHEWARAERSRLADEMARLRDLLRDAGATVIGGTDLFVSVEHDRAPDLFDHLATAGIWMRRFAERPRHLRFGLPGTASAWARLSEALAAFEHMGSRRHG